LCFNGYLRRKAASVTAPAATCQMGIPSGLAAAAAGGGSIGPNESLPIATRSNAAFVCTETIPSAWAPFGGAGIDIS
jgi:hypothetical protein